VRPLQLVRLRAILGGVFGGLGIYLAAELLVKPAPFNQKLMGLAFAIVLIGLGAVRIRAYVIARRSGAR
jgi:hypothetical protein